MDDCSLAKAHLAFGALALQQVAFALTASEHLTGAGDFKPLRNGFAGFGDASVLGHKGEEARWNGHECKKKK